MSFNINKPPPRSSVGQQGKDSQGIEGFMGGAWHGCKGEEGGTRRRNKQPVLGEVVVGSRVGSGIEKREGTLTVSSIDPLTIRSSEVQRTAQALSSWAFSFLNVW